MARIFELKQTAKTIDDYEALLDKKDKMINESNDLVILLSKGQESLKRKIGELIGEIRMLNSQIDDLKIQAEEKRIYINNLERRAEIEIASARQQAVLLNSQVSFLRKKLADLTPRIVID